MAMLNEREEMDVRQAGDDAGLADEVRLALVDMMLYPTVSLEDDEGFEVLEGVHRERLVDLIAQLSRTDLTAIYHVVRLLALFPRDEAVFAAVAKQDARWRDVLGFDEPGDVVEEEVEV